MKQIIKKVEICPFQVPYRFFLHRTLIHVRENRFSCGILNTILIMNVEKNGGGHELDERILNMKYTFSPKYCLHEKVVVHNGGQRQIREDLSHVHVGVPGGSAGDSGHP